MLKEVLSHIEALSFLCGWDGEERKGRKEVPEVKQVAPDLPSPIFFPEKTSNLGKL